MDIRLEIRFKILDVATIYSTFFIKIINSGYYILFICLLLFTLSAAEIISFHDKCALSCIWLSSLSFKTAARGFFL